MYDAHDRGSTDESLVSYVFEDKSRAVSNTKATFPSVSIRRPTLSSRFSILVLTVGSILLYRAPMPIQFILPKKFTRAQIEWRMDELALKFQGTKDKKIIAQIAALNRILVKMDASDSSNPKNRQ